MPDREDQVAEILAKVTRIETILSTHNPRLDDHEARLRELESKSGKRWDSITAAAISAVIVGVIGFVIGKLF